MPTNEQRRQAAKRKLERQITHRQERADQRKRTLTIAAAIGVVVVLVVAVVLWATLGSSSESPPQAAPPSGCTYNPTSEPAAKPAQRPDGNPPRSGTVGLTLATNQGAIPLTLDRAGAPCAVNAVASLAQQGFYDNTPCPRLVTGQGLQVLQCGDPTGSGSGGPGFQYAEEPPTNLAPSPLGQGASNYRRGLVAMAKSSQPGSTGSQFFLVYGDSALPPEYTVLGTIAPPGLAVLDRIGAGGDDGSNEAGGGKPKIPVQIQKATLAGR